ncbi:hypothetical protein BH10ACT10_BH10ACT10_00100 [soil metagenome]
MRPSPSSLRGRLVLGAVAVGLGFAVLFGALAAWRVHHAEDQAITAALQSRMELARDEVSADGSIAQDAGSPKTDLVQVLGRDGAPLSSSPALRTVGPLVDVGTVTRTRSGVQTRLSLQSPDIDLAVLAVPLHLSVQGGSPAGTGALVVATDTEGFNTATSDLLSLLLAGLAAVVLAVGALAWVLTGRALRSVARITESAGAVQPRDLAAGLPVPRHDAELTRLVEALNLMLGRLHHSHATELAFAADAGHRLRTPVATLRAEAELALRENDPDDLKAALERVVQDADRLTAIVDSMLARSRRDRLEPVSVIDTIAERAIEWHRQADLHQVLLDLQVHDQLSRSVKCAELTSIVDPVIDNAVRHTPPHGLVTIDVRLGGTAENEVHISVTNEGEPIPSDLAPHVFDAWVSTRDASVAGGLGLWLARETARDVGGDVELTSSREDEGTTTFRVRLPREAGPDTRLPQAQGVTFDLGPRASESPPRAHTPLQRPSRRAPGTGRRPR